MYIRHEAQQKKFILNFCFNSAILVSQFYPTKGNLLYNIIVLISKFVSLTKSYARNAESIF